MKRNIALTALSAVIVLGTASAVLAKDSYGTRGGYQVETSRDIQRQEQDIRQLILKQYGPAGSSYASGVSPARTHRVSHERDR
jgi:hypothetical protein